MNDADVLLVFFGLFLLGFGIGFGLGFCCGNDNAVTSTRQTLCREFIKETSDYINCNTKGLDNIVKMIRKDNQWAK